MIDVPYIHATAEVLTNTIGSNTKIWQFVVILQGAQIGNDVNICSHCFIENDVIIGDRVTIKAGVQLWDGLRIEDDVFIGPNVTFTNDKFPRSKNYPEQFLETRIEKGASIGAGAVILPGITIGTGAMIGAGAVVTKSVPSYAIVTSPSAQVKGFVSKPLTVVPKQTTSSASVLPIGVGDAVFHHFKFIHDIRGDLSVGEFLKDIPFIPKRYFLICHVPEGTLRGTHAHYNCHQFLICVKGSCVAMLDDGKTRKEIVLDAPNQGIYLPPLTWGTQYKYSSDAVLLVFASDYYNPEDYILDYRQFCNIISELEPG